jgi:acyl-CoA synthetase (AMP-forming)/AMP-acid ligase II
MSASSFAHFRHLSFFDILSKHARRIPEQVAIAAPDRLSMTYGNLIQRLSRIQEALHGLGLGRNDRVALAMPPGPELAVALLGVASTATCVPMHPADERLEIFLSDWHIKAVILPFGEHDKAYTAVHRHGIPVLELTPVPETEAGFFALTGYTHFTPARRDLPHDDDLALILPPGDTEPDAQPIGLTHAHLSLAAWQVATRLKLDMSDRCLSLVPPLQGHGLIAGLLASLMVGARVICPTDWRAETFFQWLTTCRPSWYTAEPGMHQTLVDAAPQYNDQLRHCSLRFIHSASGALLPRVSWALERIFRAPVIDAHDSLDFIGDNNTLSAPRREAWATASLTAVSA